MNRYYLKAKDDKLWWAVAAVTTMVLVTSTVSWYRRRRSSENALPANLPQGPIWDAFLQATQRVRTLPLRNGDKLILYALYKQATVGDAPTPFQTKSWNVVVEQAKWDAWRKLATMEPEQAAMHYTTAVKELEQESPNGVKDYDTDGFGAPTVSLPAVEHGGYDASKEIVSGASRLLNATAKRDVALVKSLLQEGVDPNSTDDHQQTALHMAADKGAIECLKLLLEAGGNPNSADRDGISVLQTAVIAAKRDIVALLLQHQANPDQPDLDGDTPRSCAMMDGSEKMKALFQVQQ
jgi:acyl-CoA-binding protein